MSAPDIKGWCPDAHRPMRAGDGLILRLRPPLARLSADQAHALSDLAERYGSGTIEITSRASLQLRGVSDANYPRLLSALQEISLVAQRAETHPPLVLNPFETSPLQTELAKAIGRASWPALPSKFGLCVDIAKGQRDLSDVSADIRFETGADGMIVRADGAETGVPVASVTQAVAQAQALATWFVSSGGMGPDGRGRMARHLGATPLPEPLRGTVRPVANPALTEPGAKSNGLCVAAPFGLFLPLHLRALAAWGITLTPFRMLFLRQTPPRLPADLICAPGDVLTRVAGCTGAPGCPQAQIETRPLARALSAHLAPQQSLHVSGCAKGCAHPKSADLTVVGRDGRFDLVRAGRAWDEPCARGLSRAELERELTKTHV